MADVVLVRPDDHLVVGVRWSGFTVSGTGPAARLTAGAEARILITLPPQHVGEETSPPASGAPLQLPVGSAGEAVPVWRGVLSAPTRLAFAVAQNTQIPLTAEGVLNAVVNNPLLVPAGVPGPDDTAIELPWRLVIAPRGRSAAGTVVCRHPARPVSAESTGLWRTRFVDAASAPDATLLDADLTLQVADPVIAGAADPVFGPNNFIPLRQADRQRLVTETANQPARARVTRLELSTLGGTLDAAGVFQNFEWEHRAVLGRDMHVRTLAKGAMYPLGHRAKFLQVAERTYDSDVTAGGAAVLRYVNVLTIVEPVRHAPGDGPIRRGFPLGDVEVTRTVFTDLAPPNWQKFPLPNVGTVPTHFAPTTLGGLTVQFPIACTTGAGVVKLNIPMLFVADLRPAAESLTDPGLAQRLAADYGATEVRIPPTNIDLVGAAADAQLPDEATATDTPVNVDVHEVHSLTIAGVTEGLNLADGYRCRLSQFELALPALRALRGDDTHAIVAFANKYLQNGASEDVLLEMLPDQIVSIDFTHAADRSGGLLKPSYITNSISRQLGPIDRFSLPDPITKNINVESLFPSPDATLLGFPLKSLLTELKAPPEITSLPIPTSAPEVRMRWPKPGDAPVKLTSVGPFIAKPTTTLDLNITIAPNKADTDCVIKDFTLELPPGDKKVLRLTFATMTFSQHDGKSPSLDVTGVKAEFLGDLKLLQQLQDAVEQAASGLPSSLGAVAKLIDVKPTGITVHYSLAIPSIASGAFVMRNMAFTTRIEVPFGPSPLSISLAFAARANPFQLAVMMFDGTGYIELELNRDGLKRFEASLEFGAFMAVDFVVASGEVHALGGVRFVLESSGAVTIAGYLRVGGSVEVLGLISVSIELCLTLAYKSEQQALVGRATLVIEIDLTLWSDKVELDSGEWKFAGGAQQRALFAEDVAASDTFALWQAYRRAFADLPLPTSPDAAALESPGITTSR
jgi:hypothetical protein